MNKDLKVMIVETYQKVEDLKWLSQDYITLFNKPENKDLGAERFFLRCEHAISTLKEIIELKFMARKEELQFLIEGAKAEKNEHSINLNQNELNLLTVNDFNVGFSDLAGHDCSEHSPIKSIKLKDIEVISNAIEEARAKILTGKPDGTTPTKKIIPDLPEIFKDRNYFEKVIKRLLDDGFVDLNRKTGKYRWLKSRAYLAGLAHKLEKNKHLHNPENYPLFKINTDTKQDLGRCFCQFFENMGFQEPNDRTFQNNSVTGTHRKSYNWITEL